MLVVTMFSDFQANHFRTLDHKRQGKAYPIITGFKGASWISIWGVLLFLI